MRFDKDVIRLSKAEVDILLGISDQMATALGASALRRQVMHAQEEADVNLVAEFFRREGRAIHTHEIPLQQHLLDDNYASIPDDPEVREMLANFFAVQSYDESNVDDTFFEMNRVRSAIAAEALAKLDVEII